MKKISLLIILFIFTYNSYSQDTLYVDDTYTNYVLKQENKIRVLQSKDRSEISSKLSYSICNYLLINPKKVNIFIKTEEDTEHYKVVDGDLQKGLEVLIRHGNIIVSIYHYEGYQYIEVLK